MTDVRYAVPGIPPSQAAGITAFMPHFNRPAASGAQSYKYGVVGSPGTRAHPAPTGNTQISPDIGDKAQAGTARSSDAPDVWYPQDYDVLMAWAERPGAGMPIHLPDNNFIGAQNMIPVPAGNPGVMARANQAMSPPTAVVQRIRQLPWFPRLYQAPGA